MSSGVPAASATTYGAGPRASTTSPAASWTGPAAPVSTAEPVVTTITVSGASSSTVIDHGGDISTLSRKAPRARGPSSSPASASMMRRWHM